MQSACCKQYTISKGKREGKCVGVRGSVGVREVWGKCRGVVGGVEKCVGV